MFQSIFKKKEQKERILKVKTNLTINQGLPFELNSKYSTRDRSVSLVFEELYDGLSKYVKPEYLDNLIAFRKTNKEFISQDELARFGFNLSVISISKCNLNVPINILKRIELDDFSSASSKFKRYDKPIRAFSYINYNFYTQKQDIYSQWSLLGDGVSHYDNLNLLYRIQGRSNQNFNLDRLRFLISNEESDSYLYQFGWYEQRSRFSYSFAHHEYIGFVKSKKKQIYLKILR